MGSMQEGSWVLGGGERNFVGSLRCLRHRIKCAPHAGNVWSGSSWQR